jgi:hypothetical protein
MKEGGSTLDSTLNNMDPKEKQEMIDDMGTFARLDLQTEAGETLTVSPTVHVADAVDRGAPGTQSTSPDSTDELGHVARETRPGGIPAVSPTVHCGSERTGHAVDTTRLRI